MSARDAFAAVHARCAVCDALSWPLDAVFLDHDRLLVQFASPCEHSSEQVRVVTVYALGHLLHAMSDDRRTGGAR